jgi:hypothetical protein
VPTTTFDACVVNGQLQFQAPLDALEGQRVRVTLDVIGDPTPQTPSEAPPSEDPEPPEGMDVEKDIYVKMPRKVEILKGVKVVDKGPKQPSVILPEELPDD